MNIEGDSGLININVNLNVCSSDFSVCLIYS